MSLIGRMLAHDTWANQRLVDHCAGLPADQLQLSAPGTAGTIEHTLAHVVGAEGRYLRLLGQPVGEGIRERDEPRPTLDQFRAEPARLGALWSTYLAGAEPGRRIETHYAGKPASLEAWVPVAQAIHHGHEHRTQVTTVLAAKGLEAPSVSGWAYARTEPGPPPVAAATAEAIVARAFEHSAWATEQLLELGLGGGQERLALTAAGVYGPTWATLCHLVDSDLGYLNQLLGKPDIELDATASPDAVREAAAEAAAGWPAYLASESEPGRVAVERDGWRVPAWVLVAQAIHHANEHRANVTTILGAGEVEVPQLDVWAYAATIGAISP